MKKVISLLTLPLLLFLESCGGRQSQSTPAPVSVSSKISSSSDGTDAEPESIVIPNVRHYLSYAPTRIKVYYDKTLQTSPDLYYDIVDPSVCRIENNEVIGLKIGTTTIFASTAAGTETSFTVSVDDVSEYTFGRDVASVQEAYRLAGKPANPTLFVGDSFFDIRNFWKSFNDDFGPEKNCFSVGISSTKTTDWMMFRNLLIDELNPKNIVMHIGTNDLNDNSLPRTADEYYAQITELLAVVLGEHPDTPVYYFGIENRTASSGYGANNAYAERVTARIKDEFARDYENFHYIDSPAVFNADQATYISADGIHPSAAGYAYYVHTLDGLVDF